MIGPAEILLDESFPARFNDRGHAEAFVEAFEAIHVKANGYRYGQIDAAAWRQDGLPIGRNQEWLDAPVEVRCVVKVDADRSKQHLPGGYRLEIVERMPWKL